MRLTCVRCVFSSEAHIIVRIRSGETSSIHHPHINGLCQSNPALRSRTVEFALGHPYSFEWFTGAKVANLGGHEYL